MASLSIRLLGPLQVTLHGEPVTAFQSDKVRALLAYLAVECGQAHRRERLAGLLWPDMPEPSARTNLRVALSNLRKAIADSPPSAKLRVNRQTIQLDPEADLWIDVQAFTHLLSDERTPSEMVGCLQHAVELYRGDFMQGFSLPGSAGFEEWALLQREQLQRQVVSALRRLAHWYELRGESSRALPHARRLVALEPWQEVDQRRLMRLLALMGQRNAALLQFDALRRALAEELAVEPEDETTALRRRIRDGGEFRLPPPGPPHNLPVPLTPFVGRKKDLAAIIQRLRDPVCRLLTLVGPGGSGKTRLALEAARELVAWIPVQPAGNDLAHGIYHVSLTPLQTAEGIVPTVAEALGIVFREGDDPRQQLLDYLRQKQVLLILDNFEHLIKGGADWVLDLHQTAPHVKILVTSRSRLNLQAEQLFPVTGMALPDTDATSAEDPTPLRQYDGIELFSTSALRSQPDFRLTRDNAADVVRICRQVDGMPLGILMAAAWMDSMTPAQIANRIGQSLDFLEGDWLDLPARQRSLRAAFDHSWSLLGEHEREVLQALSIFRGGFTREAVHAVAGASRRGLRRLVNQSLLQLAPAGRYEVHELLRQYAAEKLEAAGLADATADAHSAYYTTALQRWGALLKGPKQQEALLDMEVEIDNARSAWDWAARRGQAGRLGPALDGLCHFYEWRVRNQEGNAACRLAAEGLTLAEAAGTGASAEGACLLARLHVWQGSFTYYLGRVDDGCRLLGQGLALLEELDLEGHDTRAERAHALLQMADATLDTDREATKAYCERSLALYRSVGDRWGMAKALALLGSVRRRLGLYGNDTKELLEESLSLRKSLGDGRGIARSRGLLGNLLGFRQELEEGAKLYREAISFHREIGDERSTRELQGDLVFMLLALGEFAKARLHADENLAICEDLGSKRALAYALCVSSFADLHHGQYQRVHAQGRDSVALAGEVDYKWTIGSSLWNMGCAALAQEAYAEAEQLCREGAAILHDLVNVDGVAAIRASQAMAALRLGRPRLAEQCLCESMRGVVEVGGHYSPPPTISAMALYAADRGYGERAVELYALASCSALVANSHWYKDVVGQYIAAVAAALPPDVVSAARARGRARDLKAAAMELLAEMEQPEFGFLGPGVRACR